MNNINDYKIVTITHQHTHLNEIGQFVLTNVDTDEALQNRLSIFKQALQIPEVLYLATCNRILFLFNTEQDIHDNEFMNRFFQVLYPNLSESVKMYGQETAIKLQGEEAIQHLFEVASSMNSLVIGEREILRQLRQAYKKNCELGLTGDAIRLLMRYTVETAKKVYSTTKIGEKPVSVVSLAFQKLLAAQIPKHARFMLVGAGQTNRLVAKFLIKHGYQNVVIFNRSLLAAKALAAQIQGEAYALATLDVYNEGFDVIIAATGATEAIITETCYQKLLADDTGHKILIDLSIPNNIASSIAQRFNASYIPIESLRALASENLAFREKEVTKAREVVKVELQTFKVICKQRKIEVALREVPIQIKAIRQHALNTVFKTEVSELDDESRALVERMMAYMEKRCIAIPIQVAKEKLS